MKDEAHIRDSGCASSSLDSQRVQRDKWCCKRGLNSRPLPYQGSALPLSYCSISKCGAKRRSASCHSKAGVARRSKAARSGPRCVQAGCRLKGAAHRRPHPTECLDDQKSRGFESVRDNSFTGFRICAIDFPWTNAPRLVRGRRDKEVNNAIEALSRGAVTERNFYYLNRP